MEFFLLTIIFFLGAAVGSFINMLIWRVHHGENFGGRSYCDKTKKPLGAIDLIPIFSYLIFRGRCRECHTPLPLSYPLTELISGLATVVVYLRVTTLSDGNQLLVLFSIAAFFVWSLIYFAVYDYQYWEIDLTSIIVCLIFACLVNILIYFFPLPLLGEPLTNILAGLIGGGVIWAIVILTKGGGMGEGDIFIFGYIGLLLGLQGLFFAFMITVLSGSLVGLVVALRQRKLKGVLIQFVPFIAFGAITVFLFKPELTTWFYDLFYLTGPEISF